MTVSTSTWVFITGANQNFSRATRLADEKGYVVSLQL